jgi:hypothetical protein
MLRQIERVAIVADAGRIRTLSRIGSAMILGVRYEVYERTKPRTGANSYSPADEPRLR